MAIRDAAGRVLPMDAGPLTPLVQEFLGPLASVGYSSFSIDFLSSSARHFAVWLRVSGIALSDVDDDVVGQFAHHQCACPGANPHGSTSKARVNDVRRFVGFLRSNTIELRP